MNKIQSLAIALVILLLGSLTINLLLYRELKNTFITLYSVSLNPLGIDKYNSPNIVQKNIPKQTPLVVFYGDSRAYGWKAPDNDNFQFINRGINGQTSAQTLGRFEEHITPLKPQIIVIQLGINDLRMLPKSSQTRADLVNDCQENITQIVNRAREIESTVILTTLFPLGKGNIPFKYRPFWASLNEIEQSTNRVNDYLKSFSDLAENSAQRGRVILIDAYALLEREDSDKIKYYKDLLHLNRRGYQLLNQELEKTLMEINANLN